MTTHTSKNGMEYRLQDLSTPHLRNIIALHIKRAAEGYETPDGSKVFGETYFRVKGINLADYQSELTRRECMWALAGELAEGDHVARVELYKRILNAANGVTPAGAQ